MVFHKTPSFCRLISRESRGLPGHLVQLAEKIVDSESNIREAGWRDRFTAFKGESRAVSFAGSIAIYEKQIVFQVFDPNFRNVRNINQG